MKRIAAYNDNPDRCAFCLEAFSRRQAGDEVAAAWEQADGAFSLRTIPGDHFFIQSTRAVFGQVLIHERWQLLP